MISMAVIMQCEDAEGTVIGLMLCSGTNGEEGEFRASIVIHLLTHSTITMSGRNIDDREGHEQRSIRR